MLLSIYPVSLDISLKIILFSTLASSPPVSTLTSFHMATHLCSHSTIKRYTPFFLIMCHFDRQLCLVISHLNLSHFMCIWHRANQLVPVISFNHLPNSILYEMQVNFSGPKQDSFYLQMMHAMQLFQFCTPPK